MTAASSPASRFRLGAYDSLVIGDGYQVLLAEASASSAESKMLMT
jgi:hypothetical protein